MVFAISLILASGGAILIWGVDADVAGLDLNVIGWAGVVAGVLGASFALFAYARRSPDNRVRRRDYMIER
jgi:hypothetical protein